jgi:hypothetical protein
LTVPTPTNEQAAAFEWFCGLDDGEIHSHAITAIRAMLTVPGSNALLSIHADPLDFTRLLFCNHWDSGSISHSPSFQALFLHHAFWNERAFLGLSYEIQTLILIRTLACHAYILNDPR